jgi:truncated hemoglobin YjbI
VEKTTTDKTWQQFLEKLEEYLYSHGWYSNGPAIQQRVRDGKIIEGNYNQVIDYLTTHCYEHGHATEIVDRILHER